MVQALLHVIVTNILHAYLHHRWLANSCTDVPRSCLFREQAVKWSLHVLSLSYHRTRHLLHMIVLLKLWLQWNSSASQLYMERSMHALHKQGLQHDFQMNVLSLPCYHESMHVTRPYRDFSSGVRQEREFIAPRILKDPVL